jgi:hypothetical protein
MALTATSSITVRVMRSHHAVDTRLQILVAMGDSIVVVAAAPL